MENGLDLGEAYTATLGRIKAQGGEKARLGMAVLMWISHSRRPLKVDEICQAVAIQIGSDHFDYDDTPAASTLLSCCQGLATIEKGTSTVRLIHFTLQEHLSTHPDLFDRAHATMAETCLTYLNFQLVNDLPASPPPNPRDTPFLEYSSIYWGTHMRLELSDLAESLALKLLDQFDSHISAKFLWDSIRKKLLSEGLPWSCALHHEGFSALHCVSYFGLADVANALIKMNRWDMNQRDDAGMTPLIWAARCGHEEVVRLLLREKQIQPDQRDANSGRTALSWAAENGQEGVVRLLLGPRFVDPASIGGWRGNAQRVAGLLFGTRYVNPNSLDDFGRTPLSWAAKKGHEGIVKLLLGREDVNPDIQDTVNGQTPLWWAVGNGHEAVVKLLLEREDVNPNTPDMFFGQTPLSWAVKNGRDGIVKLLLGREDVNPNTLDMFYGQTSLSWAAMKGNERIVKLLLRREDVNPNTFDILSGQTPLTWAADHGYQGIVKLLLGREDVTPDTPDTFYGQTPLSWAAKTGHEEVVKLLLGREDVKPDTPDTKYGQTPLSWAASNGHEEVVKLLLARNEVNPYHSSKSGETPLTLAADSRQDSIVKLLQTRHP